MADRSGGSLRKRVLWIAVIGLVATIAMLAVISSWLLFNTYRALADEELQRQLQQVSSQLEARTSSAQPAADTDEAGLDEQLVTLVAAFPASSRFTAVALDTQGQIIAASVGPQQLAEAVMEDPRLLVTAALTDKSAGMRIGDTSLRYVAASTPPGGRIVLLASADDIRDRAVQNALTAASAGVIFVLIGVGLTALALNQAVRPLTRLAQQTADLDVDTHQRVHVEKGPTEVRELAAQLNRLLDRIDEEQRHRNTFFATVSHEIRTPLAIAGGHLEALSRYGATDEDEAAQTLAVASAEITRAGRMVESLLTLARAEEPGFVRPRTVDLGDFAADLTMRLAGLDAAVTVAPAPTVAVVVDTERLAQAVLNAVTNSVSHNATQVRIRISWETEGNVLSVFVDDDGSGFAVGVHQRDMVMPFTHGSAGSTGLGLSVIDAVVSAHNGDLVLATSPMGGARVSMILPVVQPASSA